ncbi:hypothetical protein EDB84DRAFT_1675105 [Lactarius hengduanensis]|nr:hypothetical protein EDB84DRAFT_1675105 [Lactarius hengduanensis]
MREVGITTGNPRVTSGYLTRTRVSRDHGYRLRVVTATGYPRVRVSVLPVAGLAGAGGFDGSRRLVFRKGGLSKSYTTSEYKINAKSRQKSRTVDFEYKEEHHLVEGVVHHYDPSEHEHEEWTKVKLEHVFLARVVAWRTSRAAGATSPSRGSCQDSRRLWESTTSKLLRKEYGEATRAKYFERDIQSGVPTLTQAGREALEAEIKYERDDENEDGVERIMVHQALPPRDKDRQSRAASIAVTAISRVYKGPGGPRRGDVVGSTRVGSVILFDLSGILGSLYLETHVRQQDSKGGLDLKASTCATCLLILNERPIAISTNSTTIVVMARGTSSPSPPGVVIAFNVVAPSPSLMVAPLPSWSPRHRRRCHRSIASCDCVVVAAAIVITLSCKDQWGQCLGTSGPQAICEAIGGVDRDVMSIVTWDQQKTVDEKNPTQPKQKPIASRKSGSWAFVTGVAKA